MGESWIGFRLIKAQRVTFDTIKWKTVEAEEAECYIYHGSQFTMKTVNTSWEQCGRNSSIKFAVFYYHINRTIQNSQAKQAKLEYMLILNSIKVPLVFCRWRCSVPITFISRSKDTRIEMKIKDVKKTGHEIIERGPSKRRKEWKTR